MMWGKGTEIAGYTAVTEPNDYQGRVFSVIWKIDKEKDGFVTVHEHNGSNHLTKITYHTKFKSTTQDQKVEIPYSSWLLAYRKDMNNLDIIDTTLPDDMFHKLWCDRLKSTITDIECIWSPKATKFLISVFLEEMYARAAADAKSTEAMKDGHVAAPTQLDEPFATILNMYEKEGKL